MALFHGWNKDYEKGWERLRLEREKRLLAEKENKVKEQAGKEKGK